ncbi:MAG: TIGR01777 family protein [Acidobacteria bacterium]|nr:TIGR01777 family protein [Acidobacteriota bacterium]
MRILITGATGFIGSRLTRDLTAEGHEIWALSRGGDSALQRVPEIKQAFAWNPRIEAAPAEAFEGVEAVVHLAGESVAGRWGAAHREAIEQSRTQGTRNLVAGMAAVEARPRILASSSAIGYYGDRGDDLLDESSSPGSDFLAEVGKGWESAAREAESLGVTVVRFRTGVVLGNGGGAMKEMLLPAKLGLGGPLGSGRQWWSWVHLDDAVGVIKHAIQQEAHCVLNNTAPEPVRQRDFARTMGKVLRRPAFAPAPAFMLRLILGGFANELLTSKRVIPEATRASGYQFRFPTLEAALRDLLG